MIDVEAEIEVLHPGDVLILRSRHKLRKDLRDQLNQQLDDLKRRTGAQVVIVDNDFDVIIHRAAGESDDGR